MKTRLDIHNLLKNYCENVYYQPTSKTSLKYPCFIYSLYEMVTKKADNKTYLKNDRYNITYITKNSENNIIDKMIMEIPTCSFNRQSITDNLYHYYLTLYNI